MDFDIRKLVKLEIVKISIARPKQQSSGKNQSAIAKQLLFAFAVNGNNFYSKLSYYFKASVLSFLLLAFFLIYQI